MSLHVTLGRSTTRWSSGSRSSCHDDSGLYASTRSSASRAAALRVGDVLSRHLRAAAGDPVDAFVRRGRRHGARRPRDRRAHDDDQPKLGDHVLLVDDMVDSGHTLAKRSHATLPVRFRTSRRSKIARCCGGRRARCSSPTSTSSYLPDNPWIHQPFEIYDKMRPQDARRAAEAEVACSR